MKLHPLLKASVLTAISSLVIFVPQTIGNAHPDSAGIQIDKPTIAETITAPQFNNKALYSTIAVKPVEQAPVQAVSAPEGSRQTVGTHEDWMRQAGIPESDFWAVDYIVSKESGWRPDAQGSMTNLGRACSLVQALPCSKLGVNWRDPVAALKWQKAYVQSRFGGYAGAVAYWKVNGNY